MVFLSFEVSVNFTTSPALPPWFVALMRISFLPGLIALSTSAFVGCIQSGFEATSLPLMSAFAPLSQLNCKLAALRSDGASKLVRKDVFSLS